MANDYKNKIVFNGRTLLDLTSDTVTSGDDIRYGKIGHTASGTAVSGKLHPRPEWLSDGDDAAWEYAYMNRGVDWATVLPTLDYGVGNECIVGASVPRAGGLLNGLFWAVRSSFGYALIYAGGASLIPVYATAAGIYTFNSGDIVVAVRCAAGWNTVAVPLAANTASCSFAYGARDLTQVAAGAPLAFGDYRPAPTGSITVDANGTYRNLWEYAEVIINVPTSGAEEATVEGNALVFDGDTAVDGNTLALALEATVEGKTLVISGAGDPSAAVDGNTLTVNGTADGKTLCLDATINDNILMI